MSTRIKVKDVMTTQIASVNGSTPFKNVKRLIVVDGNGRLEGVVNKLAWDEDDESTWGGR